MLTAMREFKKKVCGASKKKKKRESLALLPRTFKSADCQPRRLLSIVPVTSDVRGE